MSRFPDGTFERDVERWGDRFPEARDELLLVLERWPDEVLVCGLDAVEELLEAEPS